MHVLIHFKTDMFNTRKERENPYNPIAGESILYWIYENVLDGRYEAVNDPDAEDWGWYITATHDDRNYMIGGVAFDGDTEPGETLEWLVQIDKDRTFMEKLTGKGKIDKADTLVQAIYAGLASEPRFIDVEFE